MEFKENLVIYEIDTQKSFMKAKADFLEIGEKIQFSFVAFDKDTGKSSSSIDVYMKISEAKRLCQDILSGRVAAEIQKPEYKYGKMYAQGGVSEEKCAQRGLRTDGKALSKQFKIMAGNKMPFILIGEERPGVSEIITRPDGTKVPGIIKPLSGKAEKQIMVACTAENLKEMALMMDAYINAFINRKVNKYFG